MRGGVEAVLDLLLIQPLYDENTDNYLIIRLFVLTRLLILIRLLILMRLFILIRL